MKVENIVVPNATQMAGFLDEDSERPPCLVLSTPAATIQDESMRVCASGSTKVPLQGSRTAYAYMTGTNSDSLERPGAPGKGNVIGY